MIRMFRSPYGMAGVVALLALIAGCGADTTAPLQKPTSELHFIAFASNAPPILDTVASFYAKLGENREVRLRYAPVSGQSEEFLRFEVPGEALARRPDGTAFALGDSILITVRLTDVKHLIFDFQPSGLRFSADHPARLRVEFAHSDKDLNGDGVEDAQDTQILLTAGIWKQESTSQPWVRQVDILHLELDEVEANIFGFTGYAFAY